jgi:hypothetical protein
VVKNGKNIRQDLEKQLLEKAAPKAGFRKSRAQIPFGKMVLCFYSFIIYFLIVLCIYVFIIYIFHL